MAGAIGLGKSDKARHVVFEALAEAGAGASTASALQGTRNDVNVRVQLDSSAESRTFRSHRRVRQRCPISPLLFNDVTAGARKKLKQENWERKCSARARGPTETAAVASRTPCSQTAILTARSEEALNEMISDTVAAFAQKGACKNVDGAKWLRGAGPHPTQEEARAETGALPSSDGARPVIASGR